MESPFDKNIEFLAAHFTGLLKKLLPPDRLVPYTFVQGPPPNIYRGKHAFHSKANPESEAQRSVQNIPVREGTLVLFLGLGLGYHVERFKQLYDTAGMELVAVERSVEAFTILVHNRDIRFLRGVKLFIGEDLSSVVEYFDAINPVSFRGHRIIRLRGAFDLFGDYYTKIQTAFTARMSARLSDMLTRFAFESLWLKNFIDNIPLLAGKRTIAALKNTLAQSPALVIGAGPSLKNQLPLIAPIAQAVHIIAVDTAVGPLVLGGIIPDFIVTLDAQYFNTYDFFTLFTDTRTAETVYRRSLLVADIVACPLILKNWKGGVFFSETSYSPAFDRTGFYGEEERKAHSLSPILHKHFRGTGSLECGGSVATTAMELALYLGADPVFVTGLDLSYTGYATHVASSPFYNELFRTSNRFSTLHTGLANSIKKRDVAFVRGIEGKPVLSDFVFINYLKWIESRINYRNRVINVTKSGADIAGIARRNLEELAGYGFVEKKKPPLRLRRTHSLSRENASLFLDTLKKEVDDAKSHLNEHTLDIRAFIDRFAFLKDSTLEASRIYSRSASMQKHLLLLLQFIEKHIKKAGSKL